MDSEGNFELDCGAEFSDEVDAIEAYEFFQGYPDDSPHFRLDCEGSKSMSDKSSPGLVRDLSISSDISESSSPPPSPPSPSLCNPGTPMPDIDDLSEPTEIAQKGESEECGASPSDSTEHTNPLSHNPETPTGHQHTLYDVTVLPHGAGVRVRDIHPKYGLLRPRYTQTDAQAEPGHSQQRRKRKYPQRVEKRPKRQPGNFPWKSARVQYIGTARENNYALA
eukprot:592962_1